VYCLDEGRDTPPAAEWGTSLLPVMQRKSCRAVLRRSAKSEDIFGSHVG